MAEFTVSRVYHDMVETKYGTRPRTAIYTEEQPDVKMTSFDKAAGDFKEGDKVNITVEKNGQFTNFKVNGTSTGTAPTSPDLERRVTRLETAVFGNATGAAETSTPVIQVEEGNDFADFE